MHILAYIYLIARFVNTLLASDCTHKIIKLETFMSTLFRACPFNYPYPPAALCRYVEHTNVGTKSTHI